ncbi:type II secretion system protein M [Massilia sp. PAMC28688]|uniref:type II secretion system protein GspM n=1 Tax=Massilia sp. PAMC28688 TaxID=2861283 RepID=UPI001C633932|nr:type II secretion system protein GspM [Massilia sp. PAMC28688]QYF94992.1 type II secretion system protein M [Massilia sp. PAMC28688]
MNPVTAIANVRERAALYWLARTEKERTYLTVGGATVAGALVYMLLIDPAVTGIATLNKKLPEMREQAARVEALAREAGDLARQAPPQVTPMTKEALSASLAARSLSPTSLAMTGDYAKLQFTNVPFAGLYSWLDAQRRDHRIEVQDLAVTAGTPLGQVDATLTLRQATAEAAR